MCGVLGVVLCGNPTGDENDVIRRSIATYFFTHMLKQTEERGKDATGIATLFSNGDYCGLKMAVDATKFIERDGKTTKEFNGYFEACYQNESNIVAHIGHCRKTSVGSTSNENNHPVRCNHIVGVHNGTLTNHTKVFEELKCKRDGLVDTEAIFRLMEHFTDDCKEPFSLPVLQDVARRLDGSFTTLAFNGNNPHQLSVMRSSRPLEIVLVKSLNMLILTSDDRFFRKLLWYYNTAARLGLMVPGAPTINASDVDYRLFPDDHVGIVNIDSKATSITDIVSWEKISGEKLWRTPTTAANNANNNGVYAGGFGRYSHGYQQQHGTYVQNNANTTQQSTTQTGTQDGKAANAEKNTPSNTENTNTQQGQSDTVADCVWVRGIGAFMNEATDGYADTFKGNGVTVLNPDSLECKELTATGNISEVKLPTTVVVEEPLFTSFDLCANAETFDADEHVSRPAVLEIIQPPPPQETEVIHLPHENVTEKPDLTGLPVFSNAADVASFLKISDEQLGSLNQLPIHLVAGYITRALYTRAYNDGLKSGRETLEMKLTKAASAISAAKELITVLANRVPSEMIEPGVHEVLDSSGKENLRAYSSLFRNGDAVKSPAVGKIYSMIKAKIGNTLTA